MQLGDLVFLIDNPLMMRGVDRNAPVVLDMEDKITALAEEDTPENRVALVLRTINSLIGETSNCATGYHNKQPKSEAARKKYESYVDLLSIINGKAIRERNLWPYVVTHSKKVGEPGNPGCVTHVKALQ